MRLFEFAGDDPLRLKLVAVTKQLQDRVERSGMTLSTDAFIDFLRDNDITVDKSDLYDMVQKDPLKNIIKNINKDEVVFIGQQGSEELGPKPEQGDAEKIRQQMAKKAMK